MRKKGGITKRPAVVERRLFDQAEGAALGAVIHLVAAIGGELFLAVDAVVLFLGPAQVVRGKARIEGVKPTTIWRMSELRSAALRRSAGMATRPFWSTA
jgi:hypothetical protein